MKHLTLLLVSLMLCSQAALAKEAKEPSSKATSSTETKIAAPVRVEKPNSVTFGGLWPRGPGLEYERMLTSRIGIGAHLGYSILFLHTSLFGRWYFSDDPGSWYVEGLATANPLGGGGYAPPAPFYSFNVLGGWEYRVAEGFTCRFGAGLGISPTMYPDQITGQLNLDAAIGYAF